MIPLYQIYQTKAPVFEIAENIKYYYSGSAKGAVQSCRTSSGPFAPNWHQDLVWQSCYFDQERIKRMSS